jgi:hypothetical protein
MAAVIRSWTFRIPIFSLENYNFAFVCVWTSNLVYYSKIGKYGESIREEGAEENMLALPSKVRGMGGKFQNRTFMICDHDQMLFLWPSQKK